MKALRTLSPRAETLVDQHGFMLANPTDGSVVGIRPPLPGIRLVYALQTNTQSGLTRRYVPSIAPGETAVFGIDYSAVIPLGIDIASGTLEILRLGGIADDVTAGPVSWRDRALYATVSAVAGADGFDYQLLWTAIDTDGNIWPRTALLLCSRTA
jgi:hypothetical protein